jgi:hypothetical protein
LEPLLHRHVKTLQLIQVRLEAELVCDDNGLLVTAFPLLRDQRAARDGRRVVSCASLLLQHPSRIAMYATLLREWGIDLGINAPASVASPPVDQLVIEIQALLSEVQAMDGHTARAEALRRWFSSRSSASGWAALDVMRDVHVPASLLETAVGACLWTARAEAPNSDDSRWTAWLVKRLWNTRRFIEAYVLGLPSPGSAPKMDAPSAVLLAGAALRGAKEQPPWLSEEAVDAAELDVDGLSLLAIESLLVDGQAEAAESLAVLAPSITHQSIQGLAASASRYWGATGERLPLQPLMERHSVDSLRGELAERHRAAIEAIDDARNTSFRFILGFTVWQQLFAPEGTLAKLESALRAERAADVRGWLEQYGSTQRDMEHLLDTTAARVANEGGWNHEAEIHSGKRTACLARLVRLASAARRWAGLVPDSSPRAAKISAATMLFASDLRIVESGLRELAASSDVCAPLADLLTERLAPVLELTT